MNKILNDKRNYLPVPLGQVYEWHSKDILGFEEGK